MKATPIYCRSTFSKNGHLDECGPISQCPSCRDKNEIKRLETEKQLLIDSGHDVNSKLRDELDRFIDENLKLRFMIDNGLGWDDLNGGHREDVT